ncbi:papain-like cysteine protease family protein [Leptospira sp. SA-E8]|uniref:papain-like cysteine protease family protein n=1 Tax=Leptospira sp. SA-E8 TaxID=3422259 RepID=UPI003EB6B284
MFSIKIEPPNALSECYSPPLEQENDKDLYCLEFNLKRQTYPNWCWASIAEACGRYFRLGKYTQRQFVLSYFSGQSPDLVSGIETSDRQARLDEVLKEVGCFSHWSFGRPTFERIYHEIKAKRPVFVSLEWKLSGCHYVAISGCAFEKKEILIDDPASGPSWQSFHSFPLKYRNKGAVWQGTYWVEVPEEKHKN